MTARHNSRSRRVNRNGHSETESAGEGRFVRKTSGTDSRKVIGRRSRSTTMLDLTPEQRQLLFDKLPDAANVAFGALVFGPLLGDGSISIVKVTAGAVVWLVLFGL